MKPNIWTITEHVPQQLKDTAQWVAWRYETRGEDKLTKVPYQVRTGQPASSTNPDHWCSFQEAMDVLDGQNYSGIGFVFTKADDILGIDMDDCRDPNTGDLDPQAAKIIKQTNSYTEVSPSGTGVKIFLKASKSAGAKCKVHLQDGVDLEVYDQSRYFTVTGQHLDGTPKQVRQADKAYRKLEQQYLLNQQAKGGSLKAAPKPTKTDEQVIAAIRKSPDAVAFATLFDVGKVTDYDEDHSKADFALCLILAKHCGGRHEQIERIFSQSALGQRPKWTRREDYRRRTIEKAIQEATPVDPDQVLHSKLEDHWVIENGYYQIGLYGGELKMERRDVDRLYALADAQRREKKQEVRFFMQRERVLDGLRHVAYHGDPDAEQDRYRFDPDRHVLDVFIKALEPDIKDNLFVEKYLEETFGPYKDFMKQYLAAYSFTNHQPRLPTLVFYGPRGTSKTTAAMMVADIFPSLYTQWDAEKGNFSPEAQMKLAIVEENSTLDKDQYKLLKQYSGSRDLTVNIKYKPEYKVRNNLNIIVISNEEIPLYVETSEAPTDPLNNQFFVYRFEKLDTKPDPLFQQKLKARLGYYVQTELRRVFESLDLEQGRYGIPVPITKWEKETFTNNKTVLEDVTDYVLDQLLDQYKSSLRNQGVQVLSRFDQTGLELLKEGFQTTKAIKECNLEGYKSHNIVRQLKRKGILRGESIKKYYGGDEFRGYEVANWEDLDEINRNYNPPPREEGDDGDIFR